MALDGFVKIDGIEGESTDDKHVGWIEIIRYGVGIKQTIYTAVESLFIIENIPPNFPD